MSQIGPRGGAPPWDSDAGELTRQLTGGTLLAAARVLAAPDRREIEAAARFGGGAKRSDRCGGEREFGCARIVDLAHETVDDSACWPAGDQARQRCVARRIAHQGPTK